MSRKAPQKKYCNVLTNVDHYLSDKFCLTKHPKGNIAFNGCSAAVAILCGENYTGKYYKNYVNYFFGPRQ